MQLDELLNRAAQAHTAGAPADSQNFALQVLRVAPNDPGASLFLGLSQVRLGRPADAVQTLTKLSQSGVTPARMPVEMFRKSLELYLSVALRRTGDVQGAVAHAERAAQVKKDDTETLSNFGLCLIDAGMYAQAEVQFRRMIELAPQVFIGYQGLGTSLMHQARRSEAIEQLRKAAKLCPPNSPSLVEIAQSLAALDDTVTAEEAAQRAYAFAPSARAAILMAGSMVVRGKAQEAEKYALEAVAVDPSSEDAWGVLGSVQQALKKKEESNESFYRSVKLRPEQGWSWHALVQNGLSTPELAEEMEAVKRTGKVEDNDLSLLDFALGRCYEKLGEYEKSLDAYTEANKISRKVKFGIVPFDSKRYAEGLFALPAIMEKNDKSKTLPEIPGTPQPIFVVGMIRSGTTLMEQILSCHPDVAGGGEIPFWMENCTKTVQTQSQRIDDAKLDSLRREYLRLLAEMAPGKRFVVDKMPVNYSVLGLLARAMPNAKFLFSIRERRDNCFSIFATVTRSRLDYMHDFAATAFAYDQQTLLRRRWHELFPGRIMDVVYEGLVDEQERVTRAMLEFCGIPWSDACLYPERNERQAATPSIVQVQSPVNRSSIGRAAHYDYWLRDAWARTENSST